MTIRIELNGEGREMAEGATLLDLVASLQLTGQALAVAVNRQVIARQKWPEYALKDGDKVDIVRAIGGG
ncbi:MAG: sulfur carrier protein ThiS [Alistipes senegalensis]|nr:sulfur carrier protein ThiS [Oxalobacter formigenes]MCM1280600.1 sulfur carrier protein ThiS [Alistipes senegalensis]